MIYNLRDFVKFIIVIISLVGLIFGFIQYISIKRKPPDISSPSENYVLPVETEDIEITEDIETDIIDEEETQKLVIIDINIKSPKTGDKD